MAITMDEWITFGETMEDAKQILRALGLWVPFGSLMEGSYATIAAMCVPCMTDMYHETKQLLRQHRYRFTDDHVVLRVQATIERGLIHALSQQLLQKLCHREAADEAHTRQHAANRQQQIDVLTLASNLVVSCDISGTRQHAASRQQQIDVLTLARNLAASCDISGRSFTTEGPTPGHTSTEQK